MPIEFSTSLHLDLVYTRWHGNVDMPQFREIFASYINDRHYRPGRTELVNFSEIERFDADFHKVWAALRMVNNQVPGVNVRTRTVLIAPSDVIFGLARIYQTLADNADGIRVELYRSEIEALTALSLPYKTTAQLLRREVFLPADPLPEEERRSG